MPVKKLWLCILAALLLEQAHVSAFTGDRHSVKTKTTVAVPQEEDYDVQYIKLDLYATNTSTSTSGCATTVARVAASSMSDYYFELSDQLVIDSAKLDGQMVVVTNVSTDVRRIKLAAPLLQNTVFTVAIFYHGAPTGGTGFFTNGLLNQTDNSIPVPVTHTVSAAFHARDWFPCKQSLTDKIDSADLWISVPSGLSVASNGLLKNITPVGLNHNRYEWATRYPTDYYLLSFSVAPYQEYNYYMHFANSNDSMLVQNFIYDAPQVLQQHQDELDSIAHIINYFSSLFGRYPFDKEKVGVCMTPLSGGMENQTMVSLGSLDITLMAHELSHQWWGDHVTCQSLEDMWLNEGFATYCEQLFLENFYSVAAAQAARTQVFNTVMGAPGGSVFVDDTTQEGRIYDGRLTYFKGAAVAHMLRFVMDDDNQFFQVLKDYQQQFAFKTATTEDLKNIAEQISGQSLDTFFEQWIYKEGYPLYQARWAQSGNKVVIKLTQTTSVPASVSLFKIPLEIRLRSMQGDTTFRVLNNQNVQYFTFTWAKPMNGISLDPGNHIVNIAAPSFHDPTILDVRSVALNKVAVYPNPAGNHWTVKNLPAQVMLKLTDINGRLVWYGKNEADSVGIPAEQFANGMYNLTISDGQHAYSYTLLKQ